MDNYERIIMKGELDLFLIELFGLTNNRDNVGAFEELFRRTFDREPSYEVIDQYKAKVSYESDYNSYEDSYEDSYREVFY